MIEVYNKKPIDIVYSFVKELATKIPIYQFIMDEDKNSIPESYLLLRPRITDTPDIFGGGETKTRTADCDMILVSKGYGGSKSVHRKNIKKIEDLLDSKKITYSCYELGYDDSLKSSQYTFSVSVKYYG